MLVESVAYATVIASVIFIAELHLRAFPWVGAVALAIALYRIYGRVWTTCFKMICVLLFAAVAFYQKDIPYSKILLKSLLFINVIIMAVPTIVYGKYDLAMLIIWLAIQTPEDLFSPTSLSYCISHFSILTTYYLFSSVSMNTRVLDLITVIPMLVGMTVQSVERCVLYRTFGMLVVISLPRNIWSRSVRLPKISFRTPIKNLSEWNFLSDNTSFMDNTPFLRGLLFLINVALLLRISRPIS